MQRCDHGQGAPCDSYGYSQHPGTLRLNPSARTLAPGDWVGGIAFPQANTQLIEGLDRRIRYWQGFHPGSVHLG